MGEKPNEKKVGEEVREVQQEGKGKEGEKRRKEKEEENREEEKRKERRNKRNEEGNRNQRRAGRRTGRYRTQNCASRGRFSPTLVILRLRTTQWLNSFAPFQGEFKMCVVWSLLCDGQRPVSRGFRTL